MSTGKVDPVLSATKPIRLGVWGLGRGAHLSKRLKGLGYEIVAACDYNEHMRKEFSEALPNALVTDDAGKFLAADMDAVLLATFCVNHADDAIRCLNAGKHVLSEVTAFHTLAEGVRLVEAVERSGKTYMLAENYPFTKENLFLADRWRKGLFGELMYAEYEYVHEIRALSYTYIDGNPVQPGWTVHQWRSWLNYHYYNTHSLGPVMYITGQRPVRTSALPGTVRLAGYLVEDGLNGMGGISPSLITFENGGLMRNLMGATTNDTHYQRLWGTRGSSEWDKSTGLALRLGGHGDSPKLKVKAEWPFMAEEAEQAGHGGGDFWTFYYFAHALRTGQAPFFDVYRAADCTSPGILAVRSSLANGQPFDVPDFRKSLDRARYREDHWAQKRYDTQNGALPASLDRKVAGEFTAIMKDVIEASKLCRAALDWISQRAVVADEAQLAPLAKRFVEKRPAMPAAFERAQRMIATAPHSDAARVLGEMLVLSEPERALSDETLAAMRELAQTNEPVASR